MEIAKLYYSEEVTRVSSDAWVQLRLFHNMVAKRF